MSKKSVHELLVQQELAWSTEQLQEYLGFDNQQMNELRQDDDTPLGSVADAMVLERLGFEQDQSKMIAPDVIYLMGGVGKWKAWEWLCRFQLNAIVTDRPLPEYDTCIIDHLFRGTNAYMLALTFDMVGIDLSATIDDDLAPLIEDFERAQNVHQREIAYDKITRMTTSKMIWDAQIMLLTYVEEMVNTVEGSFAQLQLKGENNELDVFGEQFAEAVSLIMFSVYTLCISEGHKENLEEDMGEYLQEERRNLSNGVEMLVGLLNQYLENVPPHTSFMLSALWMPPSNQLQ